MPAASSDSAHRFEALARLGQALTASLDLPRVLETIAGAANELLPEACARIWVAEGDRLIVKARAGLNLPGRDEAMTEMAFGEGLTGHVALSQAPVIADDIDRDARAVNRPWLTGQRFVSFAGMPLLVKDKLLGVLTLMTRDPHPFTLHEVEVLGAFAAQAAIAIENARLYTSLSARVRRLNALTRLNRLISSTLDPEEVLREIATAAGLLMEAKGVSFWRSDDEQSALKLVAYSNDAMKDFPRQSVPFGFDVIGWVARHRETVNIPDVSVDERFVMLDWWKQHGLKSLLGLPVLLDGKLLAVLSLNGDRPFQVDGEDADLLDSFAAQAAVAIRNASLFAESERRRRTAEALERIGRSLARSLEPEEVGRRTVESVGELVHCEMALLYRLEPTSGDLVLLAGPTAGRDWNQRFPQGTGAVGLAVRQGQPVMTTDVRGDTRITLTDEMRTGIERLNDRAVLAVPLAVEDRTIGALAIVAEAGRLFTDEETSLVQAFAGQAALSLDNAQLLHESRSRQTRLETLLDVSRQLSGIQPLEPLLDSIAEACGRLLGSESVGFRLVDGDDLVVTGIWGDAREIMSVKRLKRGESLSGLVAEAGHPLIVTDPANDARLLPALRDAIVRHGYRAWLGVPVKVGERLTGVLSVRKRHEQSFTEADVAIATAFASQAAVALENARLYAETQERLRQTETLLNVSRAVSGTQDLTEALRRVARETGRALRADMVGAYLADPEQRSLQPVAGYHVPSELRQTFQKVSIPLAGYALLEEAWQEKRPAFSSDAERDPRIHRGMIKRFPHRTQLFVPMIVRDVPIGGLFVVWWTEVREFTAEELRLIQGISEQGALTIANAELYFEASRRRRQAEELARLAQSLTESLDVDAVAQRVVDSVRSLFGAMYSRLRRRQPDGTLPLMAGSGEALASGTTALPAGIGIAGLALASGRPEWSSDVLNDGRLRLSEETLRGLPNGGRCALLAAPLRAKGAVIGVLTIGDHVGRVFSDEEIGLLQTFADQAALALQNARLFEESERRRRGAEALLDIAQALASTLELGKILSIVTRRTAQALGAERCTIFLRERQQLTLMMCQFADGRRDDGQWARLQALPPCRVEDVPAYAEAAQTRRPVAIADASATTAIPRTWVEDLAIRSLLVVPILSQDRLIGVLNLEHTTGPGKWTEEQADLAMTIANQTALAVENARLFAGQREEAEVSSALLRLARATEAVADLDGILETVARVAPQFLGHARCTIYLFEPADETLALATAIGFSDAQRLALAQLRGPARIPAVVEAIRSHEPVAVENAGEGTWIPATVVRALDVASILIIPMVSGGRMMGTMAVDTPGQRTTFSDKQISLARSIAAHAASAIERAGLYAEAERRHREAEASEHALRASETRYRLVARASNDAIWDWDLLTNRIAWNEGVQTLFGYAPEAASGDAEWWIARIHPEDRDRVVGGVRTALDSGSQTWFAEFRFQRMDGTWAMVADRAYVVYTDGQPVRMLGALADMSERRQAAEALRRSEEHVRQMQKMEAIGRLAGGIAHDFNNLLTVITGRSQLLLRRLREADPVRQDIGLIQKTAERAGALTRQLLAFSRKQVLQPRVVDANTIVQGLAPMLQRLLGEDVDLVIRPAEGARIKVDPGQLEQVIVNLSVNARDAMPGGGRLVIAITCVELDEAAARQHGGVAGPHVELAVSDSGVGMDAETQARLFEPFFTTKAAGHGTGLGLATVYGIVQQHQGAIAVETAIGRGTTFRIYLPATTERAETVGTESGSGLTAGSETVLVVEDEEEVRALTRDILEEVGYTVLEAANGQDAIEVVQSYPLPIHLLLSDVIMPQMSGHELAQHLQTARPEIKVLYMSGYTADVLGPRALLADRALVQKPFTPESLTRKVRQAIDAQSTAADD